MMIIRTNIFSYLIFGSEPADTHPQLEAQRRSARSADGSCGRTAYLSRRSCGIQGSDHRGAVQGNEAPRRERGRLKKREGRVNDDELFTRLLYYGIAHLHLSQDEVWTMPFGLLLDLWECHKQFTGIARPKREQTHRRCDTGRDMRRFSLTVATRDDIIMKTKPFTET